MKRKSVFFYVCCLLAASISILALTSFCVKVDQRTIVNNKIVPSHIYDRNISTEQPKISVRTNSVKNITATSADCYYNVTVVGSSLIASGICINKGPAPTITTSQKFGPAKGSGFGPDFRSEITGLTPGMKYYVRAYAISATGTIYGNELSFTTLAKK